MFRIGFYLNATLNGPRTHIRLYAPFEQHTHYMVVLFCFCWQRPASRHPTVRPSCTHKQTNNNNNIRTTLWLCVRAHTLTFVAQDMRFSEQFIADNKNARSVNALLFQRPLPRSRTLSFLSLLFAVRAWLGYPGFQYMWENISCKLINQQICNRHALLSKYKKYRFNINRFVRVYFFFVFS